jgi:hypothetical protein
MIRKKPAPDLIRGGYRFSEKIMLHLNDTGVAGLKGQKRCRGATLRTAAGRFDALLDRRLTAPIWGL